MEEKVVFTKKRKFVSKEGICLCCTKNNGYFEEGCDVLKERIGEYDDDCFAFTDDKKWEKKVNKQVLEYAFKKGITDYIPIESGDPYES